MNKMLDNGKIYILKDPQTGFIRYVGKYEGKYINERLKKHIEETVKYNKINHKTNWIKSLIEKKINPIIEVIDEGYKSRKELCEAEIFLIQFMKDLGVDLVNTTKGGDGGNGLSGINHPFFGKKRPEHSKKMKGKIKPLRSEEHRKNLSLSLRGRVSPNKGKKMTQDQKLKISKTRIEKRLSVGQNNPMFGKKRKDLMRDKSGCFIKKDK